MTKKTVNYIDKEKFYEAMVEHKKKVKEAECNGLQKPQISNYLSECVIKIARNMAQRSNFATYTYKDEMISDGIENIIMYFDNFDPENSKQNPFGYFTKICWYAFLRRMHKEALQHYVKCKSSEMFGSLDESELMDLDDEIINEIKLYDNLYEFMEQFEEKLKKKKKQPEKKPKGVELFFS